MTVQVKTGSRLRSAVCGTEIVVVRAPAAELDLRCGGLPMAVAEGAAGEKLPPESGFDTPTELGKRYIDGAGTVEVLCVVAGPSTLSIGAESLEVKAPKPLPASD